MKQLIDKELTNNNGQVEIEYQDANNTEIIVRCGDLVVKQSLNDNV